MNTWTQIWFTPGGGTRSLMWLDCSLTDLPWTTQSPGVLADDDIVAWFENNQLSDADPVQLAGSTTGRLETTAILSGVASSAPYLFVGVSEHSIWPRMETIAHDNGAVTMRRYHSSHEPSSIVPTWYQAANQQQGTTKLVFKFPVTFPSAPQEQARMWCLGVDWMPHIVGDEHVFVPYPGETPKSAVVTGTASAPTFYYEMGWAEELVAEVTRPTSGNAWHILNKARKEGNRGSY